MAGLFPWETAIEDGILNAYLNSKLTVNGGLDVPLGQKISFGDKDTYLYEYNDDDLRLTLNSIPTLEITSNRLQAANSLGGAINFNSSTSVIPSFYFRGDDNTGVGRTAADQLSLIAGGVQGINIIETAGIVQNILPQIDDAAKPTLAFGNGDTGLYEESADVLRYTLGGNKRWLMSSTSFGSDVSGYPKMLYEVASATNPNLIPNSADSDTGIGLTNADQLSLIAGGVQGINIKETAGIVQNILPQIDDAANPTLAFGNGDTGLYEESADVLRYTLGGNKRWLMSSTVLGSDVSGYPRMLYEVGTSTNPNLTPNSQDSDTGIGFSNADQLSLIAGGVEGIRIAESAGVADLTGAGFNKWVTYEPYLDENTANVANKPTLVSRGLFNGYSLPVYAAGEELLFRMRVPFTWDGTTAPVMAFITSISAAEDIGDKYKFQLEWASGDVGGVIPAGTTETLTDEITVSDGTAYYAEIVTFTLTPATLAQGQNLQFRLRRITSAAPAVSNEIIIWHWSSRWKRDKIGTESTSGY